MAFDKRSRLPPVAPAPQRPFTSWADEILAVWQRLAPETEAEAGDEPTGQDTGLATVRPLPDPASLVPPAAATPRLIAPAATIPTAGSVPAPQKWIIPPYPGFEWIDEEIDPGPLALRAHARDQIYGRRDITDFDPLLGWKRVLDRPLPGPGAWPQPPGTTQLAANDGLDPAGGDNAPPPVPPVGPAEKPYRDRPMRSATTCSAARRTNPA